MANGAPGVSCYCCFPCFLWAETHAFFHTPDRRQEGESHMRAICSLSSSEGHWSAMFNIQAPIPLMLVLGIDLHILMLSVRDGARKLNPAASHTCTAVAWGDCGGAKFTLLSLYAKLGNFGQGATFSVPQFAHLKIEMTVTPSYGSYED